MKKFTQARIEITYLDLDEIISCSGEEQEDGLTVNGKLSSFDKGQSQTF